MNKKILGLILIVIGVALAFWGYNLYDATSAQVTRALNGSTPMNAWVGMVGGAICVLVGLSRLK